MKKRLLYLDSADIADVRRFSSTRAISGLTTNPSLMAKQEKGDYVEKLLELRRVLTAFSKRHFSVEVTTLDPDEMIEEAWGLHLKLRDDLKRGGDVDLHVKVPLMSSTLRAITTLKDRGVKVNATACMTALQAKLAADAGAHVVSFFYNRMLDGAVRAEEEIRRFVEMETGVPVICGSIRKASDVLACWEAGADAVTASAKVIDEMASHPKTDEAIAQFQRDIDSWRS